MSWKDTIQPIQATDNTPPTTPIVAPPSTSTTGSWKDSVKPIEKPPGMEQNVGDLLKGIGQGATAHFGSNIAAGAQTAKEKLDQLLGLSPESDESISDTYNKNKAANDQAYEEALKRSPKLTGGGEIAGAMIPIALTGGAAASEATLGQQALSGAKIGALYSGANAAGESKNSLTQNPLELAKDVGTGSAIGAVGGALAPVAINKVLAPLGGVIKSGASAVGNKLADMSSDVPLLQKLGYAFNQAKSGAQTFTGAEAGQQIQDKLKNTAASVTKQLTQPIQDASDLYGQTLDTAAQNGAKLSIDPDLMSKFQSAQKVVADRGGLTPEMQDLLNLHGSQSFDPESVSYQSNAIDPRQAKNLQLSLRQLGQSKAYQDTNAISDLERALTPAINQSLPESDLNRLNDTFAKSRQVVEPLINKGVIDSDIQGKQVSDIDPDVLNSKINDFIKKNIGNMKSGNYQGDVAAGNINDILGNISNINKSTGIQFANANEIGNQINDAAMATVVRQGIVGKQAAEGNPFSLGGLTNMVTGSPYRVAQIAGQGAAKLSNLTNGVKGYGNMLASAGDDVLTAAANKLKQDGPPGMGESLDKAIQNKSDVAKNAALFSILQNPNARKAIGVNNQGNNNQ